MLQGRQIGQSKAVLESTALFEHQAAVAVTLNGPTVVVNSGEELFLGRSEHESVVEVAPSKLNALLSVERLEFREGSDSVRRRKGRHALAAAILGLERRKLVAKYEVADGPKRRGHQFPKRGNLATGLEAALDDGRALDAVEGVFLVELDEDPPWVLLSGREIPCDQVTVYERSRHEPYSRFFSRKLEVVDVRFEEFIDKRRCSRI